MISSQRMVMAATMLLFIVLSACKIDVMYDIAMNQDDSGTMVMSIMMEYPFSSIDSTLKSMDALIDPQSGSGGSAIANSSEKAFCDSIFAAIDRKVMETQGITVSKSKTTDLTDKQNNRFVHELVFDFAGINNLCVALGHMRGDAVSLVTSGSQRTLRLFPQRHYVFSEEVFGSLIEDFEVNADIKISLPKDIISTKYLEPTEVGKRQARWKLSLGEGWLSRNDSIEVTYPVK